MEIIILDRFERVPNNKKNTIFLEWDNWNDFGFLTAFGISYVDDKLNTHNLGSVRIGFFGQAEGEVKLSIGDTFEKLDDIFFSLGTDVDYYIELKKLGADTSDLILNSLNDIAKKPALFNKAIDEQVTQDSLLRGTTIRTVIGQYRRIASGGAKLTKYNFNFSPASNSNSHSNFDLSFNVQPESFPPTNVHVLIGRNGVGKTYLLNKMIEVLNEDPDSFPDNEWHFSYGSDQKDFFANLIFVSFSAFDESDPVYENTDGNRRIQYSYIGLKQTQNNSDNTLGSKSTTKLMSEFLESLKLCRIHFKKERWKKGIEMLESDPNFKVLELRKLIDLSDREFSKKAKETFRQLSSGHKIVLLTITRIIENIQEKSLILIDEPEGHLHPPLLSAFIRTLSELLINSNAVAIIATHSPVVLQEVPKSCVWKLRRHGKEAISERLNIESFGENVGILTNEVFGLEVTDSGFYNLLKIAVQENNSYEEALAYFGGELGSEARALLMSLYYEDETEL